MSTETIDLKAFCREDSEGQRYNLDEPFVINEWRYATNGYVAIRLRAAGSPDSAGTFPQIGKTFAEACGGEFSPLPESVPVHEEEVECDRCDGTGFASYPDCEDCDGSGEEECDACGHVDDCSMCFGKGFIGRGKCEACGGKKSGRLPYSVTLCGLNIRLKFFEIIKAFPGPVTCRASGHSGGCVAFRFDGGEAIVMSRIPEILTTGS